MELKESELGIKKTHLVRFRQEKKNKYVYHIATLAK